MVIIYCVSKKVVLNYFAITSSSVDRLKMISPLETAMHFCKTNMILLPLLKNLTVLPCETYKFKNTTIALNSLMTKLFLKFVKHLQEHITLLTYLLSCPVARVPVTSSQR